VGTIVSLAATSFNFVVNNQMASTQRIAGNAGRARNALQARRKSWRRRPACSQDFSRKHTHRFGASVHLNV
jgi:hypothetical protein